ncbi:hypothetical protein QTV44_002479 [Vibrio vulnificus]|nr:hypothetical protein [Vibrio vulnificus]
MLVLSNYQGTLERGMYIYQSLYNVGLGVIVSVDDRCNQVNTTDMGGVCVSGGGSVHVVYFSGHESHNDSEAMIRSGGQFGVSRHHEEQQLRASDSEIAMLLEKSKAHREEQARAEASERKAFAQSVAAIEIDPQYAHLAKVGYSADLKDVAKNVRAELKHQFPRHSFSVRCGGNAIRVHWQDGVTQAEVQQVLNKFKTGTFCAYTDYHDTIAKPFSEVYGGAQFLFYERQYSDVYISDACKALTERYDCHGLAVTAQAYSNGQLCNKFAHNHSATDLQTLIHQHLIRSSRYQRPEVKTARSAKTA